jgi:hypothetical protein
MQLPVGDAHNMTLSWQRRPVLSTGRQGLSGMMIVLLVAGIGVLVAGLVAIAFGIPVKEFSLGNTLILAGVVAACSGLIMLGLAVVVRELRTVVRRLDAAQQPVTARERGDERAASAFGDPEPDEESASDGPLFLRDQPALGIAGAVDAGAPSTSSWQEEAGGGRARQRGNAAESAPETKPRRNLLFSSSSRKERERTASRAPDLVADDLNFATPAAQSNAAIPSPEAGPSASFEDAWPQSEPIRSEPSRRGPRKPSAFNAGAPAEIDDRSQVTVLKSGVVDGMAYSLYSDGSIEAQMPEGMMRFASIGELRAHLDQRA